MPEFNNIKQKLNDGEKFALVCGMLAGLKLQDKTLPPSQVTVTLEPIGVGGLGGIGLMASDVEYTGENIIRIPVVTHDVDREYSGFSLSVSYDNSRIAITSIDKGEFGDLQATSVGNGKAYTRCMLDKGQFKKEPCIMCYLNCRIVDPPTKGNPIELKFNSSSGYDPNYCTLLTWVLNDIDSEYYSYFITPTVNQGCKITSETEANKTESNLGDSQQISAKASPNLIALGTTYIEKGSQGLVPIYVNSNKEGAFAYNGFTLRALVSVDWLDILDEIGVESTGEWTLTYSRSYDSQGNLVLDIQGTREASKVDNSTVGFIRFKLSEEAEKINCDIINEHSELLNDGVSLSVTKGNGYIYYPKTYGPGSSSGGSGGSGGGSGTNNSGSPGWGNGQGTGGGTGGGMRGSGTIWSATEQTIWIDLGNGNKYPVYLKPGFNNVEIWLPNILPEDMWQETTPKIESEGYILIPGGFSWETIINPEAPLGLSSPRLTDRFEIKDLYNVRIEQAPIPINLDEILDTFKMMDITKEELINVVISNQGLLDNFELEDFINIELEAAPFSGESNHLDTFEQVDIALIQTYNVNVEESPISEIGELEDFVNVFIPQMLPVTGTVNNEAYGSIQGLKVYEEQTTATLRAVPNSGYMVNGWYIDDTLVSTENTITFLVDRAIEVFLEFIETLLSEFDLAINKQGSQLVFTNESSIPWYINTDDFGGVRSGAIGHSGSTFIQTEITETGVFMFDYKVSSEGNYDKLLVYKNDNLIYNYSGTATANEVQIGVNVGDIIKFTYSKDSSGSTGSDSGFVRNVYILTSEKINETINKAINKEGSTLVFNNTSEAFWIADETGYGGIRTGVVKDSGYATIETTIEQDGTLYFDYKVSSERNYDKLIVIKNSTTMYSYSGESSAEQVSLSVVAGDIVKFTYQKDSGGSSGSDCAWIKNVYIV